MKQLMYIYNFRNVDMLVKDIYGCDYSALGLPGDLIASSFGKIIQLSSDKEKTFRKDRVLIAYNCFKRY